ncbi:MAG: hypothetical protein WA113_02820 [Desulfitobacteriaceae bacterium]
MIKLAVPNKTVYLPPQLISYENTHYYLQMNSSGCLLYKEHSYSPLYQLQEPLLLIQGMAANSEQVHLVMLKGNGDLCYTLINGSGQNQTTVLAKLDVRTTRYRRLLLFPLGKTVHIFYAYSHYAIPDLWRIEHRFWNGKTWRSVNLGEVFHSREPLYDIVLDREGNLHLLMMTFQGRQTLILTNRFNGSFYLWGNTLQSLQIQQEVIDMTSIMTPDNIHHLFWLAKTANGKIEVGWAYLTGVQELSGNWLKAPAALQTLNGPIRGLGSMEINGGLWLLVHAEVETLLFYKGDGWKQIISNAPTHRHLRYIRKNNSSYYNAYWLEESQASRTPAYHQQLGLNFNSMSAQINQSPYLPSTTPPTTIQSSLTYTQASSSTQITPINSQIPTYNQSAYNTVQSPIAMSIPTPPVLTQPTLENILQFAYDDYPDDLIPPAATAAEAVHKDNISEETNPLQESLELPSLLETLTTLESESSVPPKGIPQESNTGTFTIPNGAGAILETLTENSHSNPPQSESELNQKKNKSRTLKPKKGRNNSSSSLGLNTGSTTMTDSLPVFAPQKVSFIKHNRDNEHLTQVLAPMITKTLDPILKTIVGLESQVNQLQNDRETSFQKIEQLISTIQIEREREREKEKTTKEHQKGFWAKWFK